MKVEALKDEGISDFIEFCRKHKMELDDSYLYDEDLRNFKPSDENPTYIIRGENDKITAAASLIIDDYHRRGKKARFRIFYSETSDIKQYKMLLESILRNIEGLNNVFIFIPLVNEKLVEIMKGLNFKVERYSFLLIREESNVPEFVLPEGYHIKPLRKNSDEEVWCSVRNAGFAKLKGSETPVTPEGVAKMLSSDENIEGGSMILYHGDTPVGVVRGSIDEYEDAPIMNIGPLAIIPEYQGKGLGRLLLRAALTFAREKNYNRTVLCVNAENERAKALYLQEGFKQAEAVVCYKYDL